MTTKLNWKLLTKVIDSPSEKTWVWIDRGISYPMIRMTHPSRNFFVLSLFCVYACLYS